jgi:1,2-diacylglycerol 3-alpha-glucosyltransferase
MKPFSQAKYLLLWDRMGDYHRARVREVIRLAGESAVWAGDLGAADEMYGWESVSGEGNYFRLSEKPVENVTTIEGFRSFRRLVKKHQITHVCIPGYGRGAYILMIIWSKLTGRHVLVFAESWYAGFGIPDYMKGLFLRWFTHAVFISGTRARKFFTGRLKYPPKKLFTGYSVVDNQHFASWKGEKDQPQRLLCVARFSTEKNMKLLIRAFGQSRISDTWLLEIVGGGPQKSELTQLAEGSAIELRDWVGYRELPELYSRASCFVLPSNFEPWGLVVNEAMAAGLPIILSDQAGAAPDLLDAGRNGWLFNSHNENELVRILDKLATYKRNELDEMGKRSKEIVKGFNTTRWAETITGKW